MKLCSFHCFLTYLYFNISAVQGFDKGMLHGDVIIVYLVFCRNSGAA